MAGRPTARVLNSPKSSHLPAFQSHKINQVDRVSAILLWALAVSLLLPIKTIAQSVDTSPQNITNYSVSVQQLKISSRARAHLERAQKAFAEANMLQALEEVERTLASDPQCAQAFILRSLIKLSLKDVDGAATDSGQATTLDPNGVKALAALPSLDELRARIIGLIQAPATKIAQVVNAPAAKLARVVQAYAAKSGEGAAA